MTRHPFNMGELGRDDPSLAGLAEELERVAAESPQPPAGFHQRVLAAIDAEPAHRRSWFAALHWPGGGHAWQAAALGLVLALGIGAAMLAGGMLDLLRQGSGAPSPVPSFSAPATVTPSPSPTPSTSPSPTPTPTPSPSPTASPSADDDGTETPQPTETPDPSDNSGPGGGDGGNPGPGGGDDSSGPGSGG